MQYQIDTMQAAIAKNNRVIWANCTIQELSDMCQFLHNEGRKIYFLAGPRNDEWAVAAVSALPENSAAIIPSWWNDEHPEGWPEDSLEEDVYSVLWETAGMQYADHVLFGWYFSEKNSGFRSVIELGQMLSSSKSKLLNVMPTELQEKFTSTERSSVRAAVCAVYMHLYTHKITLFTDFETAVASTVKESLTNVQ